MSITRELQEELMDLWELAALAKAFAELSKVPHNGDDETYISAFEDLLESVEHVFRGKQ